MAFKGGQPIQAGLGAANFSPIVQGGMAMGQAYANTGGMLANAGLQAVQQYQQRQQQKAQSEAAKSYIMQNMGLPEKSADAFVKGVGVQNMPNLISQIELKKLDAMMASRKQQELAGISEVLPFIAFAKDSPDDPTVYDLSAGLELLDQMGFSDEAKKEFRLQVKALNDQAEAMTPEAKKQGLEDRKTFINMNPESPDYGKTRIYGASEENGQYIWIDPKGERIAKDADWMDYDYVKDRSPTKENFSKMREDLIFEEEGLRKLDKLKEARGAAGSGVDFLKNRLSGLFKTVLGGKAKLTDKELAAEEAQKRLNSSIGAFRNEIVGPGIVTEFDAKRIEDALGGALTTGNFQVVERLLDDIMLEKRRKAEILRSQLEAARQSNPALQGAYYNLPDPYQGQVPQKADGQGQAQFRFNPETGTIEAI